MKIKPFIIILFTITGFVTVLITSYMTYLVIGEPIGNKMRKEISFGILYILPIICIISYIFGNYLSKKFKFIQIRLEKIKNENFEIVYTKNAIKEITDIAENMNHVSRQMDSQINKLKEKNNNLSNLLVSVSHDMKTPITILNGYIDEIEDGLIKQDTLPQTLKSMKNEVNFLDELAVEMIEFISSMREHKEQEQEQVNVYDIIEQEVLSSLPKKADVTLENKIEKDFIIKFNRIDFKKVVINILSNAIKYTSSGYVKMYIQDNKILFENNGEEIKDEFSEKIFEPFFRVSKSRSRKIVGFGLGLSIVDNLTKNNNYKCYLYENSKEKTIFALEQVI